MEDIAEFGEEDLKPEEKEHIKTSSVFFYIGNAEKVDYGEYIYFDSPEDQVVNLTGTSMNESYIFFWNLGSVWKLSLKTKQLSRLALYISEKEIHTYVVKVRTGSDKNIVCVRVHQSPQQDCII